MKRSHRRNVALSQNQLDRAIECWEALYRHAPSSRDSQIRIIRDWLNQEHRLGREWQRRQAARNEA